VLAVWLEPMGTLPPALADDVSWLGEAERRRCEEFRSARRRAEFLAGRDLLRRLLVSLRLVDGSRSLALSGDGAPRVEGRPDIHLSLSHRQGWQAAAVSDGPVGIDVEIEGPRETAAVARRFCSASEQGALAALSPEAARTRLHTLWALKEAAFKAAWPAQAGLALARLESRGAAPGTGGARSWRWPDGRVLAVAAAGFDSLQTRGLEGAAGPACWDVAAGEPL
jgi:4'-phosphopantetheinyl transferase